MIHPLIDLKNSTHYDNGEKNGIQILEEEMTICEMRGFAYGNIRKYEIRLKHKGQAESDEQKIWHYRKYLQELTHLQHMNGINSSMIVSRAWTLANIEWDYS